MSDKAQIELIVTTKELIKTFHKIGFSVNRRGWVHLAILGSECVQTFINIIVD